MKIILVAGERPKFMKIAQLIHELEKHLKDKTILPILVHTGQHYDISMSQIFFPGTQHPRAGY